MAIGRAYFEKGMKEESITALEKVVQVTPENILAQKLLSQMFMERGDVDAAIKSLSIIELLNPDDVECRLMLEALRKSAAKAEQSYGSEDDKVISTEETAAQDNEGFVFLDEIQETEQHEEQLEPEHEPQETVSLPEKGPLASATLAELFVSQGFLDRAINVYRELLESEPDNEKFRVRLNELEFHAGGPESESVVRDAAVQEKGPETEIVESCGDYQKEKTDNISDGGNSDIIISTLQCWLENIRRGRYYAERDTQSYS
ncbi:MAG TPA: tetratricopeptide repeat protein [Geobacteraceae bacterium]|nr:tetratricopeptide repeat protein [Geobacteraceae bacterium]